MGGCAVTGALSVPNTRHFRLVVLGDGSFEVSGNAIGARQGDGVHRLTALLIRAKRDGLGRLRPPTGAVTHTFTLGADAPPAVRTYADEVAKAFGLEL